VLWQKALILILLLNHLALAGEFLAQHNKTQTTTADREVVDIVEGLAQNRATNFVGDNEPHNNIPPSYGIYIWKRVE